jgi:hypothetical protein
MGFAESFHALFCFAPISRVHYYPVPELFFQGWNGVFPNQKKKTILAVDGIQLKSLYHFLHF